MRKRLVLGAAGVLLLIAVGAAAALFFGNRREVTTSSDEAYRAYRAAVENERRYYLLEARDGFAKALELDPQFCEAMLGLARLTEGDKGLALVRRAAKERERLTARERMHVDLQLAGREGKMDEQLKIAREIHDKYPDDIRAAMALASHEMMAGNSDRALQIFGEVLAVEPNNANAYNLIGYYYAYRGDYDRAIENLRKYQFMAPDQANPYDSLGEIQAYSGHYDEAIENLNQALRLKPDFFNSYLNLGVAYEGKGEYPKAIESYLRGAQEVLDNDMRRQHLRQALRTAWVAGDLAVARDVIARYRAVPGDQNPEISRLAMDALVKLMEGRPAEAEKLLEEVRPLVEAAYAKGGGGEGMPGDAKAGGESFYDPTWNYLMAHALLAQGRSDGAIVLCRQLANPPRPWNGFNERRWVYAGRALLAELLARKGDLDEAEKLLAENRKWNPSWAPTRGSEQVVAQLRREKVLAASK
jgi:tetratricopeptide (TPR) repeat protein